MTNPLDHIPDGAKYLLDFVAVIATVGTIAKLLPPMAALLAIIWTSLQIFGWVETRIEKRRKPKE